jgi:predicted DNA-binding protein
MENHNTIRSKEQRASRGLTLRLDIDTQSILDMMKERTGKTKGRIINEAVKMWFADYKKRHRV